MCGLYKFPINVNSVLLLEYNLLYNGLKRVNYYKTDHIPYNVSLCVINEVNISTPLPPQRINFRREPQLYYR